MVLKSEVANSIWENWDKLLKEVGVKIVGFSEEEFRRVTEICKEKRFSISDVPYEGDVGQTFLKGLECGKCPIKRGTELCRLKSATGCLATHYLSKQQ